jgi:hypothetical protein
MSMLNVRSRSEVTLVSGRIFRVLNADFPEFQAFVFILLAMNPTIVPVGVPGTFPSRRLWN